MKNVLCFIMFVCYSLWECGSSSGYFIDGVVEDMKEGRVFILKQNFMKDEFDTLTSAVVKDGKFTIRGSVRGPTVGLVGANGIMGSIVFLENNARYQFFLKVVGNPVIAGGGESQELYRKFIAYDLKLTEEL